MAPNELDLRALSLGYPYDLLSSGKNDTSKLLTLGQKKHGILRPSLSECFLRRKQAIVWEIWIPWNCPMRKFTLAMLSGHTSFSCPNPSRAGIRHVVKGAFKYSIPSLHVITTSKENHQAELIILQTKWHNNNSPSKSACFQRVCPAATEKQENFSCLKAKEENWDMCLFTFLTTSVFLSHLYGL